MRHLTTARTLIFAAAVSVIVSSASALEPPTREQLEQYRRDGSLARRAASARRLGNHRMAPHLVARLGQGLAETKWDGQVTTEGLPSTGTRRMFTLLIAFSDYPGFTDADTVDDRIFGDGASWLYPYESLREYYRRSSYGLLEIRGSTLGWYTTAYPRRMVEQTDQGREAVIREAIAHFNALGHDFAQYDSDSDGEIDYFAVIWAGPHQEWAEFWWGYQRYFQNRAYRIDGKSLGAYSWQWEAWDWPGPFTPHVLIHETGHALGLPDYYDYDDSIGPLGGVGGLDMMDGNWGDHNCFSKFLLGWLTPQVYNQETHQVLLAPAHDAPEAVLLMHGDPVADPYAEYFMVQYRRRQGNDTDYPTDGLLIWHLDARRSPAGGLLCDNSFTEHKLLRLMEADGLEEIELDLPADAGDFWHPDDSFGNDTTPDSRRYDRAPTNLLVDGISTTVEQMGFRASLGSGCALWCEADVTPTAWPGVPIPFDGSVDPANCQGTPSLEWRFGDGSSSGDTTIEHPFTRPGSYDWSLETTLGDASCSRHGSVTVCAESRCWQWRQAPPMAAERGMHAVVPLADGRVLVAGGGAGAEIFDPGTGEWGPTGPMAGVHPFASGSRLHDGRVLVVGSWPGSSVNAEIYDPATDCWSVAAQLDHDRVFQGAVTLADGRVMVAGGYFFDALGNPVEVLEAEVFNPFSETWSAVGSIGEFMQIPGLTVLRDGRVLVTGSTMAQLFDPAAESWTQLIDFEVDRTFHAAVALGDGRVLLAGGAGAFNATIYDPATGTWEDAGRPAEIRNAPAAVMLRSGSVLVAGGADNHLQVSRTVEIFDPATGAWSMAAPMDEGRVAHSAAMLPNDAVLVVGGAIEWHDDSSFIPTRHVEQYSRPSSPPRRPRDRRSP